MAKYTNAIGTDLSCGAKCLKYLIFVFNFVFWLAGAVILGVGIWMAADPRVLQLLQMSDTANSHALMMAAAIVFMVVGALMFLIGGLGCCGAIRENVGMLSCYCFLLGLLIILQIVAGVLAIVFRSRILKNLKDDMTKTIKEKYKEDKKGKKDAVTVAVDYMQVAFRCCGAESYQDWGNSTWLHSNPQNFSVPLTCCVLKKEDYKNPQPVNQTQCEAAGARNATGNPFIYAEGCYAKFNDFIIQYGDALIGIAFGFIVLQIIGIIFVCCLRSAIKQANTYEEI